MKKLITCLLFIISIACISQNINRIEYFFNTDPGFGNGIAITGYTPSANITNFATTLNVNSLQNGINVLYVRALDATGSWSLTNNTPFIKISLSPPSHIVRAEYFLNTDPGFGLGTAFSLPHAANISQQAVSFNVASAPSGVNTFYVRVQDSTGNWSLTNTIPFVKGTLQGNINVIAAEYFIDTDPGFGMGTSISIVPAANISNYTFSPNLQSLALGAHKLYVRAKDANGRWSLTNVHAFHVLACNVHITAAAVGNTSVCQGANVVINSTSTYTNLTYQWYNSNTLLTTTTSSVSANTSGTYKIAATDTIGCKDTSNTVVITVHQLPIVTASATVSTLCAGGSTILSGGGASTYVWSGGVTNGVLFVPTATSTYTVTGTDANACMDTATTHITVNTVDIAVLISISGSTQIMMAHATPAIYQWINCNGNIPITGQTNQSFMPTAPGNYAVIVTQNTCTDTSICYNITTGIVENSLANTINIYPNPFTSQTTITFTQEQKNTTIKIMDVLGKEVKTINFTGKQLTIEKAEMKPGIYFVQITDDNKNVINRKIVVQ